MKICLTSVLDLSDEPLCLSFGDKEEARLASIENRERKKETLCALLALRELVGEKPLTIARTPEGKPYFDTPDHLPFSLTHTEEWAAAALGDPHEGEVGIDLELLRPYPQAEKVSVRFFTEDEQRDFSTFGKDAMAFFRVWTKKEAIAKLGGQGFLSEDQIIPAFCATYLLTRKETSLLLTVATKHPPKRIVWQTRKEDPNDFYIEELR